MQRVPPPWIVKGMCHIVAVDRQGGSGTVRRVVVVEFAVIFETVDGIADYGASTAGRCRRNAGPGAFGGRRRACGKYRGTGEQRGEPDNT